MWSISCAFRSNGRSMTSSTQHSSPHIRKRRSTDQTTTNPPQTSSKANQNGKWSKSWEQGTSDDLDDSNIESNGQVTPTRTTPGKLRMTYMLHSLLRNSGKETKRWLNKSHISQHPPRGRKLTPSPYHS